MQERFTGLVPPRVASGSKELLGDRKSLSSVIQSLLSCALMKISAPIPRQAALIELSGLQCKNKDKTKKCGRGMGTWRSKSTVDVCGKRIRRKGWRDRCDRNVSYICTKLSERKFILKICKNKKNIGILFHVYGQMIWRRMLKQSPKRVNLSNSGDGTTW